MRRPAPQVTRCVKGQLNQGLTAGTFPEQRTKHDVWENQYEKHVDKAAQHAGRVVYQSIVEEASASGQTSWFLAT